MNKTFNRANMILEAAKRMAKNNYKVLNYIEEIQLYSEYGEPGYTTPECGVIALGNWNRIGSYSEKPNNKTMNNIMERIGNLFEKMGIECEWSDEWISCGNCGKLYRTQPDCYYWKPSYIITDGDVSCTCCIKEDPDSYIKSLEGNSDTADTLEINLKKYGYVKYNNEEYESGWYEKNDNPKTIARKLIEQGIERFVFQIEKVEQFRTIWTVWIHEDELNESEEE